MKITTLLVSTFCVAIQLNFSGAFTRYHSCPSAAITSQKHQRRYAGSITSLNDEISPLILSDVDTTISEDELQHSEPMDNRPFEQRVDGPRKARRLNHPFQHLYRHSDPSWKDNNWNDTIAVADDVYECYNSIFDIINNDKASSHNQQQLNSTFAQKPIDVQTSLLAIQYLYEHGGYSFEEIHKMHAKFASLLEIDVVRQLRPKMRFLKDCLGGSTADQLLNPQLKDVLRPDYFGSRLERTIAPRHAFLVHIGLPSGKALWDDTYEPSLTFSCLLDQFLIMHRKPKQFAAMCNSWRNVYGATNLQDNLPITSEQITAFDKLFQRGILSAARDDSSYTQPDKQIISSPSLLQTANVTSAQLVQYLIQHGANPYETDVRGASLFHWAAGAGNLEGLKELVIGCDQLDSRIQARGGHGNTTNSPRNPGVHAAIIWKADRDDAIPLHWAAAGAGPKEFGIGGHISVCNYLLELNTEYNIIPQRSLIDSQTKDGNSVLMWAAWSRSLQVVKMLVRNRADTTKENRNGCTVSHWAASGGGECVCMLSNRVIDVFILIK